MITTEQKDDLAKETAKLLLALCRELHQGNEHILARGYLVDALKDFPSLELDIKSVRDDAGELVNVELEAGRSLLMYRFWK